MLFVPADSLDQVTRYVGGEQPSLDRLGGSDWGKRKNRARRAVREIAAELIKLYAARQATQGHAFGADTPWQRELEDAFPFHETPDQLTTVEEVKADMRRTVPMDRLVCGDVGYGKTEIAVRAAFKAVQEGKQVAVLVPTTLLVQQHYTTFAERMGAFPVTIRALSRFQTDREAREVAEGLREGSVDIVIGTHRLLNPDVKVKDLGLIVVDEEQRFGVEHKEQMKRLRTSVDVLSMSATPIPRTLEMAITGIREMSTITTPPEERHPVLTYVGAYEDRTVSAAIRRELLREGQVFFIHNRVQSIEKAAARHPRAGARGAGRGRPRPDGRAPARAGDARLLGEALRRAGLHDDRRVGPRRLQRQHHDHRARRHPRPLPAPPAPRPGRRGPASAPTPTSSTRPRSRSPRPPTSGWPPWPSTPTSAAAWRSR